MGCAAFEMALGTSIRPPGEYFENLTPVELSEENTVQPSSQYAKTFCSFMNSLRYTVPRHPKKQPTYVDPLLFRCSQVFVRIDNVKSPLQRPYSGPHFVLERHDKYFVIKKDGHLDTVTNDRLKPALVEPISPTGSSVEGETSETLSFWSWWWFYTTHSWGWGRGSIPRNPNSRATTYGRDQRSRREGVWPKMARRRGSSTGQSSTRCERSCGSEPQLLHEGVLARPTLWR